MQESFFNTQNVDICQAQITNIIMVYFKNVPYLCELNSP